MAQKIFQLSENRMPLGKMAPLQVPLVIYVEASSYCNLACNFCPHYLEPERMNKLNMSLDVFKKVIDDIYDFLTPYDIGAFLFNHIVSSHLNFFSLIFVC